MLSGHGISTFIEALGLVNLPTNSVKIRRTFLNMIDSIRKLAQYHTAAILSNNKTPKKNPFS